MSKTVKQFSSFLKCVCFKDRVPERRRRERFFIEWFFPQILQGWQALTFLNYQPLYSKALCGKLDQKWGCWNSNLMLQHGATWSATGFTAQVQWRHCWATCLGIWHLESSLEWQNWFRVSLTRARDIVVITHMQCSQTWKRKKKALLLKIVSPCLPVQDLPPVLITIRNDFVFLQISLSWAEALLIYLTSRETGSQSSHLLAHSPDACHNQDWATSNPKARSSIQSPM